MRKQHKICSIIIGLVVVALVAVPAFAQTGAEIGVFEDREIPLNTRVEVPVEIRGVTDLYAVDVELKFDPEILSVEDADPKRAGVQPGLGTLLDPGMTLYNEVDNEKGIVRFVMSQINPSEPKTGDGILLVLYFVGKKAGASQIEVKKVEFSTRYGEAIAVSGVDAKISVSVNAPEVVATAIPVQDQSQIIVIETLAPTPTATAVPKPTTTPVGGASIAPSATSVSSTEVDEEKGGSIEGSVVETSKGSGVASYWWLLLLPLIVIAGLVVYAQRGKPKKELDSEGEK